MIRNQVTQQLIRFNGTHYKRLLRKQNEPGSPKFFLKKDIARLSNESKSTRKARAGGSNANDVEMTSTDLVKCEVCFDDVPLIALIDLGCQGGHRACANCIKNWCVEKLPLECSCPFCRQPIRSHEALKSYMTNDMIQLYTAEQTPQNRAEFVFRSAEIKFKPFEDTPATEFERMTVEQVQRVSDNLYYYDEYVRGHVAILTEMADDRNRRRLRRMGEDLSQRLFCMNSFVDLVFWEKEMSSLENARRDEITRLINRDFNIRNHRPENLVARAVDPSYMHTITIQGKWLLYDVFHKVGTYVSDIEFYSMSLTHAFRKGFVRFRLYEWLSDLFTSLPGQFQILDAVEVNAEADYLFMVDPKCRSYHKFEYHTPKPVTITLKIVLRDRAVDSFYNNLISTIASKAVLSRFNDDGETSFKLETNQLHPDPQTLPVEERIPFLYKFHIDRITSQ